MSFLKKQKLRWRVVPIALLVFACLLMGFDSGEKAAAYLAYIHHDYATALQTYSQIDEKCGCGNVLLAMNMPDEAMKYFQQAGDQSGMGLACCKKRCFQDALQHFQTAQDNSGMGLAYLGLRDEANAKDCFTKANNWSGLGLLALAKQNYAEATRCFSQVNDYSGLGLTELKQKHFTQALQYFQQAQDTSGIGLVCLASRDHSKAVECFQGMNDQAGMGYVYLATGNSPKAYQCFVAANDLNGIGDYYSQLHQFSKAREAFEKDNNPVKVIQSYRNDYTLPDKLQQAIAYGQTAVAAGNHVPECLMEMADIYYELGHIDVAIASLNQAASTPGYASQAHLLKGRIYFYERQLDQAAAEFSQVTPDDLSGDQRYVEAQQSLAVIATYKALNVQVAPAQGI